MDAIIAQLDQFLAHPIVVWGLATLVSFGGSMVGIKVGMARIEGKMAVQDERMNNINSNVTRNENRLNDHSQRIGRLESSVKP